MFIFWSLVSQCSVMCMIFPLSLLNPDPLMMMLLCNPFWVDFLQELSQSRFVPRIFFLCSRISWSGPTSQLFLRSSSSSSLRWARVRFPGWSRPNSFPKDQGGRPCPLPTSSTGLPTSSSVFLFPGWRYVTLTAELTLPIPGVNS